MNAIVGKSVILGCLSAERGELWLDPTPDSILSASSPCSESLSCIMCCVVQSREGAA